MTAAECKSCSTDCAEETSQHIQCEGQLLKMDSVPNGCSKEPPPEVCERPNELCHQAALFIKLYDKKEARMRELLSEIQEIGVHVKKWNTKSKWSFYTGLVSAAVAVGAGIAIPFAGGVGFAITAALTSVSAGGAVFGFKIKQFRTEEESLKRIKHFLKIVNRLEHELEELMKLCEGLHRGAETAETPNTSSLKNSLVTLFQSTHKLRAADGVKELTAQCQTVFDEFKNMRKQVEAFRGSSDAENTQAELQNISENSWESAARVEKITENSTLDSANEKRPTDAGGTEAELENSSEASSLLPQQQDNVLTKTQG